jgi:hypothetical protein
MLRSMNTMMGFKIAALDDDIGKVDDFYFDDTIWTTRYLVVQTGNWLQDRRVLVSPAVIDPPLWERELLPTRLSSNQVEQSPPIDLDKPVSQQMLEDLHHYYGWPDYWGGNPMLTGTPGSMYSYWVAMAQAEEMRRQEKARRTDETDDAGDQADPHLRSARAVKGYRIQTLDGEIGHLDDLFVDEASWFIRYLLIDTGNWLKGHKVLISPDWVDDISWAESQIRVTVTQEKVRSSPEYDPKGPINRQYEGLLYDHYEFPGYWL